MELTYGFLIEKTGKKIKQELQKEINRLQFDITVDQWVLLYELFQHGSMPQVELAQRTLKDAPTITRILDLLIAKDLIEKAACCNDRRRFNVELSPKGTELVKEILPQIASFRSTGWQGLSLQDWDDLQRILHTILSNFPEDGEM